MICTRCSCNCCCCGCCCCCCCSCCCCCWCQGQWMRRRRSMYWKIAKKNLSYTKTNTLRLHFVADCCWLPSPVTRLACRLIWLLLLFVPEGDKIILHCWHILCLLNQPTERTESNRTELNWTELDSTVQHGARTQQDTQRVPCSPHAVLFLVLRPKVNPNLCMLHLIKHLCSMTACCCMCSAWCVVWCGVCLCVCMKSFHMIYSPVQWSSQRRWSVPSGCSPAACCKQIWWPEN